MVDRGYSRYSPNYCLPPGAHLEEIIEAAGMKQSELARRTGLAPKTINEIVKGKQSVTPETALQFERVLGTPASYWNNLEGHYRDFLARAKEIKVLSNPESWLSLFPLKEMIREGIIISYLDNPVKQAQELLNFFGVASIEAYSRTWAHCQVKFRVSTARAINCEAVYAWLRQGEIEGNNIACRPYDERKFLQALKVIKNLTVVDPKIFSSKMVELSSKAGVALVFVPALPNTGISGATRWLTKDKALIQLSLRYGTNDHFWFSFYHEAAHILMHGKRNVYLEAERQGYRDNIDDEARTLEEQEANSFAANMLIPEDEYQNFDPPYYPDDIVSFARKIGIHPGIVVGRLQHDNKLEYRWHNGLKVKLVIVKEEE